MDGKWLTSRAPFFTMSVSGPTRREQGLTFFYGDRGHFSILGPDSGPALLPHRRRVSPGRAESARAALLGIRILLALAEEVGFQSAAVPAQGRGAGSGTQAPAVRPEVHDPGRPRAPAEAQA